MRRFLLQVLVCVLPGASLLAAEPAPQEAEFFEKRIRPLFADHCYKCHSAGAEKVKGGLLLDTRAGLLKGGDTGPGFVAGAPDKSLLVEAVRWGNEELKMPPKKKLTDAQIADVATWVKMGAPWPGGDQPAAPVVKKEFTVTDKDRAHWAFRPVKKPAPPTVKNQAWIANPIDAFVLARLEAKGLTPSPPADKRALVRRIYYDVTGLPPAPEEVEAFVADTSPRAWEGIVDRLLASRHYGEQWARHWLDLVRFAETNSYERDNDKPRAWRYRDYVIRSFNDDKPYDQFIREQLAGDELPAPSAESIIATGFYRLGIWDDEPADGFMARYDMLDDILTTTGQVFLGLTIDCARCHDHKIDPIGQRDYYALLSFFHNVNQYRNGGPTDEVPLPGRSGLDADPFAGKREGLETRIAEIEEHFRELHPTKVVSTQLIKLQGERVLGKEALERYLQFQKELSELKSDKITGHKALAVTEAGVKPPETFILLRGNPANKGDKVEPAFLQVLDPPAPVIVAPTGVKSTGRRLALANWIASPDNQLTARVMVNRVWQHHFGRGLVRSPNNFGLQGDAPTHPELLDWLASEFVEKGWSLKTLHRLILTSNTYRMSSRPSAAALEADPPDDFLSHFDMRRLTAEEIRDSLLAVTGTLNSEMFGPGVYVDIPKEVLAGQSRPGHGWGKSSAGEQARRSIYIFVKRSLITPILVSFDQAETDRSAPVRFASTQPTQALTMLNSAFVNEQAGRLAARIRREGGEAVAGQVRLALQLATARPPSEVEISRGVAFIDALQKTDGATPEAALKTFCLLVLNLNEFLYLD